MVKYYGNKRALIDVIKSVRPIKYNSYVEICAGMATVATDIVGNSCSRILVEKDPGQAALLKEIQQHPQELTERLLKTCYSPEEFEWAYDLQEGDYVGCSRLEIAVAKYILLEQSYNAMGTSYRDISRGSEDDVQCLLAEMKWRERYRRQVLPNIYDMSAKLQGADIIEGDMFDELWRMENKDTWVTVDTPYRPALRSAGMRGYATDMSEADHYRFCEALQSLHALGKLNAKVTIFGYVEQNLQKDMYCQKLLPLGFKLYFAKSVYLPKVCSDRVKSKRKSKRYECIFCNYELTDPSVIPAERIYSYEDVFGGGDNEK